MTLLRRPSLGGGRRGRSAATPQSRSADSDRTGRALRRCYVRAERVRGLTAMSSATAVKISAGAPGAITVGDPLEPGLRAWRGLLRAHACLTKRLDAELERCHGMPMSSFEVLHHLARAEAGRMRMRDLAEHARLSRSG